MSHTTAGLNLLIADKADPERDALANAFAQGGGAVHRLDRFWDPPAFDPRSVRVYGADSFCLVLQQKLGFALCSPADDLLLHVPARFLQRRLEKVTLGDAQPLRFPAFIKPVTPKQFRGVVYQNPQELAEECRGLPPETEVFVSKVVQITAEVRSFVLDGRVLDASAYEGTPTITDAIAFTSELVRSMALPRTVVVDVGFMANRGWAVIEFNASWGAGLNGCDATKVLPAIVAASGGSNA
ncbi:MAG TPA: ATP-grasp domain-containing protein [Candidatus Didemnitutus sp.]|nr:ATP-grasp domain-containing protein [Candidatus Didemnitutus sp.]